MDRKVVTVVGVAVAVLELAAEKYGRVRSDRFGLPLLRFTLQVKIMRTYVPVKVLLY